MRRLAVLGAGCVLLVLAAGSLRPLVAARQSPDRRAATDAAGPQLRRSDPAAVRLVHDANAAIVANDAYRRSVLDFGLPSESIDTIRSQRFRSFSMYLHADDARGQRVGLQFGD